MVKLFLLVTLLGCSGVEHKKIVNRSPSSIHQGIDKDHQVFLLLDYMHQDLGDLLNSKDRNSDYDFIRKYFEAGGEGALVKKLFSKYQDNNYGLDFSKVEREELSKAAVYIKENLLKRIFEKKRQVNLLSY